MVMILEAWLEWGGGVGGYRFPALVIRPHLSSMKDTQDPDFSIVHEVDDDEWCAANDQFLCACYAANPSNLRKVD